MSTRLLRLASAVAVVSLMELASPGWPVADAPRPGVFVTPADVARARHDVFVRHVPAKVEAFRMHRARADRWLSSDVPATAPFDRRLVDGVRDLAIVSAVTGEAKYARKATELLRALARGADRLPPSHLYLAQHTPALVFGLDLLTRDGEADVKALQDRILTPILHTLRARSRRGLSTHDVWINAAVTAIGGLRRDRALIEWAIFDPSGGILRQIDEGILADGIWHDRAIHYHFFALAAFLVAAEAVSRSDVGLDLYAWTSPRGRSLRSLFLSPLGLLDPHLTLPGTGDSFGTPKLNDLWHYQFAWRRYRAPEFAWALSQSPMPHFDWDVFGAAGTLFGDEAPPRVPPPGAPSRLYPAAGWISLRSTEGPEYWGSDAVQVRVGFGGGGTHDHADKLALDLSALSTRLIEDKSVFAYGDGGATPERPVGSRHLLWDRQTVAHSTVVVDGRSQPGAEAMFQPSAVRGTADVFANCGTVKVGRARADAAYPGFRYERLVALVADEYVLDLFRVEAEVPRRYDWVLHVNRPLVPLPRTSLAWRPAPAFAGGHGYDLIRNLRVSRSAETWSLEWPKIRVWMAGGADTTLFLGEAPGGPTVQRGVWSVVGDPEPSRIPVILARRETAKTTFPAVIETPGRSPEIVHVAEVAASPDRTIVRVHRRSGVDLMAVRWAPGDSEPVIDPVTGVSTDAGGAFTFVRTHGGTVGIWSDGIQSRTRDPRAEYHRCANEAPRAPAR